MMTDSSAKQKFRKCPTGVLGLDQITNGGLPRGRTSLVCGAAGCGKTMLAMQFLANGALLYGEPGVFMSFEESEAELAENFLSMGLDLNQLVAQKQVCLDYIQLEKSEIAETGDYDLEGLFIRLGYAIDSIGAKRVVLDTVEALFSRFADTAAIRAELRRLFCWLKARGVTAIVTGEQGDGAITRHGIEEYVSDCVILLNHRVAEQISTRRLRIAKYRGSAHGTNEYPFLIDEQGICIMPITSVGLDAQASEERVSSGVERLDAMLGGGGFYVGSNVLISGTAGTGKTSLAASVAQAAFRRGERCLYFAFEESRSQIVRNMRSIGIDLEPGLAQGLLQFHASRPTLFGLEMHLVNIHKCVDQFKPQIVILDPISNMTAAGNSPEVKLMLTRLLDQLKLQGITTILLDLSSADQIEQTEIGISSLVDTWIALRDIELNGERNRGLYLLKSRGMAHSNQIREFVLSDDGIQLLDVYVGTEGVLTGSARYVQEEREAAERVICRQEIEQRRHEIERRRQQMETAIVEAKAAFEADRLELEKLILREESRLARQEARVAQLAVLRRADEGDR